METQEEHDIFNTYGIKKTLDSGKGKDTRGLVNLIMVIYICSILKYSSILIF